MPHLWNLLDSLVPSIAQERAAMTGCPWADGARFQRDRLATLAEWCVQESPQGDLIEIGCFEGHSSAVLAEVARRHGRRLICVDPWQKGSQNCLGSEYERFRANIEPYAEVVDVIRDSSLSAYAIEAISRRDLCFAWVDGLHTYEACRQDIVTVAHCTGVIAVDDVREMPEVRTAFLDAVDTLELIAICVPCCREALCVGPVALSRM